MLLLVRAVFDFGLPRWINVDRGPVRGRFCRGLPPAGGEPSLLPEIAALDDVAHQWCWGIGQNVCWYLGIDVWFLGLLLLGTKGRTRLLGGPSFLFSLGTT